MTKSLWEFNSACLNITQLFQLERLLSLFPHENWSVMLLYDVKTSPACHSRGGCTSVRSEVIPIQWQVQVLAALGPVLQTHKHECNFTHVIRPIEVSGITHISRVKHVFKCLQDWGPWDPFLLILFSSFKDPSRPYSFMARVGHSHLPAFHWVINFPLCSMW